MSLGLGLGGTGRTEDLCLCIESGIRQKICNKLNSQVLVIVIQCILWNRDSAHKVQQCLHDGDRKQNHNQSWEGLQELYLLL